MEMMRDRGYESLVVEKRAVTAPLLPFNFHGILNNEHGYRVQSIFPSLIEPHIICREKPRFASVLTRPPVVVWKFLQGIVNENVPWDSQSLYSPHS